MSPALRAHCAEAHGRYVFGTPPGLRWRQHIGAVRWHHARHGDERRLIPALIRTAHADGYDLKAQQTVEGANEAQKSVLTPEIIKRLGVDLSPALGRCRVGSSAP